MTEKTFLENKPKEEKSLLLRVRDLLKKREDEVIKLKNSLVEMDRVAKMLIRRDLCFLILKKN